MTQILLILIGVTILLVLVIIRRPAGGGVKRIVVRVYENATGQTARKRENKEKVLALLGERGEISNEDIREALGVSAATVVRYMDELEQEGKIGQVGSTGHAVKYRLKSNTSTG